MKAKEKILKTADRLFYENGIRAVGIDTIISEAGVAKATLYNNFPSKNDLIIDYLESRSCSVLDNIDNKNISIIEYFQGFLEYVKNNDISHCPFISAMSEFTHEDDEVHKAAVNFKKKSYDSLKKLAEKENLKNPEIVAEQLMVISNGASIQYQIFGKEYNTKPILDLVKMVVENHKK